MTPTPWTPPAWYPEEIDTAGPEHLDPAFVAGFDRKQGYPDPAEDLAALRAAGVGPDATVIDLGAGTGRFAFAAAREFGRVVAVDVSPAMVAHLRERAAEGAERTGDRVPIVVRGGFLSYRHEGPPADAVHTRHALHQLPDAWKAVALTRIAGMLRPGGILRLRDLILDFRPAEAEERLNAWLAEAPDPETDPGVDPRTRYVRADYVEHLRTEHSTFRYLLEAMLDDAGFELLDADFPHPVFGAYTCRRR
ncbi:class I SAM-dependent methyltransferase [Streptomyces calidiresistens]|uniref:Methyltransferase domain-containing protein n=1 Tax=Streptomyces calidiresistens TaxID=1485586 RepID=A0A7W3T481_9ACTN|nr:class I SAM-dependent methyltransferase [Streptomyces calidiresistens]MBB0230665.1 methyltransferase domain-containing protein [Streptomyces calidiresistens]